MGCKLLLLLTNTCVMICYKFYMRIITRTLLFERLYGVTPKRCPAFIRHHTICHVHQIDLLKIRSSLFAQANRPALYLSMTDLDPFKLFRHKLMNQLVNQNNLLQITPLLFYYVHHSYKTARTCLRPYVHQFTKPIPGLTNLHPSKQPPDYADQPSRNPHE